MSFITASTRQVLKLYTINGKCSIFSDRIKKGLTHGHHGNGCVSCYLLICVEPAATHLTRTQNTSYTNPGTNYHKLRKENIERQRTKQSLAAFLFGIERQKRNPTFEISNASEIRR